MTKWFISRQHYWGVEEENALVVEIASGGLDYANADMLSDPNKIYRPLGCDWEYNDPKEALKAAIAIRNKWEFLSSGRKIRIETGHTGGYTMPFTSFPTDEDLQKWADEELAKIEKCVRCGDPITGDAWYDPYDYDIHYCSQFCIEETMANYEREENEDDEA